MGRSFCEIEVSVIHMLSCIMKFLLAVWMNLITRKDNFHNGWLNVAVSCRMVMMTRSEARRSRNDAEASSSAQPSLAEVVATLAADHVEQSRVLSLIAQTLDELKQDGARVLDQPSTYKNFLETQPAIFSRPEEPLDADHWLQTIERKFTLH